jgi:F-type H+-transporting ATPase subunit gamma
MATLRDIKRKIGSIQSTQTITRTMKMVAASKLRRAQEELEQIRAYALKMEELTRRVIEQVPDDIHPLLGKREEVRRVLVVSIASDRGLCGGFNNNISLNVENFVAQNRARCERVGVYAFGRKVKDYLLRRKVEIVRDWVDVKKVDQEIVDAMANELISYYVDGTFDKIYLVYTHFHSPVRQTVMFDEFLPISKTGISEGIDYLYEPEKEKIIHALIPRYVSTKIYFALAESQTSEHAARMSAMENATSNCGEMINRLTLVYNKRRQESITNEMMDIVGGAEALRGT